MTDATEAGDDEVHRAAPTQVLRDFATLRPLAFAVAHCRERSPEQVLNDAWWGCEDALVLARAAEAPDFSRVWVTSTYPAGPWWAVQAHRRAGWLIRAPDGPRSWWTVRSQATCVCYGVSTLRRALRRIVPLRALVAHVLPRGSP